MKTCTLCKESKPFSEYHKRGSGYKPQCKACRKIEKKKYLLINKDKISKSQKEYYIKHKDKIKAYFSKYQKQNAGRYAAHCAKRSAIKQERTPSWLETKDLKYIECLYSISNRLSGCLQIKHHVDHIIPLQGKRVSGLHVPSNLQVVSYFINLKKNNKYEIIT